jgi:hypothetical protein
LPPHAVVGVRFRAIPVTWKLDEASIAVELTPLGSAHAEFLPG